MTSPSAPICTCPNGDGSLRHPCPGHPIECVSGAINLIDAMLANADVPTAAKARLRTVRGVVVNLLERAASATTFDFVAHLERQQRFSAHTFGPGSRAAGIVDHIRKELLEIEADPGDLREWVDVIILALDGAWRTGAAPQEVIAAVVAKQTKNEARVWPHWSTMPADKAIEHDRSHDAIASPAATVSEMETVVGVAQDAVSLRDMQDFINWNRDRAEPFVRPGYESVVLEHLARYAAAPVAAAPVDGPYQRIKGLQGIGDAADYLARYPGDEYALRRVAERLAQFATLHGISTLAAPGIDPADPWRGLYAPDKMPKLDGVNAYHVAHPDLPSWPKEEDEERGISPLVKAQGFELEAVFGEYPEDDDADPDYCAWLAQWEPTPPTGEHWRLVCIQDTEDGPAAFYVRPFALIDASPKGGITADAIREAFPLFDETGLDEKEHCCESAMQHDRKRLHAMLQTTSAEVGA